MYSINNIIYYMYIR